MFKYLSKKFSSVFSQKNVEDKKNQVIEEIRQTFLSADTKTEVVDIIIKNIEENWIYVKKSKDLENLLQKTVQNLFIEKSFLIKDGNYLFFGLQGSGKTTSIGKIAKFLKDSGKSVLLVSLDDKRHAASEQLQIMANKAGVDFFTTSYSHPLDILSESLKQKNFDIRIYDTAGKANIQEESLEDLLKFVSLLQPVEKFLVVNSLAGKQTINIIKKLDERIGCSGIILTSCDGDDRGGLSLSISHSLSKPIMFLGTGEKITDIEQFDSNSISKMVTGSFNLEKISEFASSIISDDDVEKIEEKMQNGKLDYNDFLFFIEKSDGMLSKILRFSGSFGNNDNQNEKKTRELFTKIKVCISSMNPKERKNPELLDKNTSRLRRIAKGSGMSFESIFESKQKFDQLRSMGPIKLLI
jgi:signal recognition particle subunit SRP54